MNIFTFFIIVLVTAGSLTGYDFGGSSYSEQSQKDLTGNYNHEAWVCAQLKVEKMLKNPSSAEFQFGGATVATTPLGNNKYKVESYVNAQNSFGATARQNFTCIVTYKPDTDSCITACNFLD